MDLDGNKNIVRQYFEDARNHPELCRQIFAPRVRFQTLLHATESAVIESSPELEISTYAWLDQVWGNWQLTIEEIIAEGDAVMVRWTFSGTHQGEYYGLPPTHLPVTYNGINIFHLNEGKIIEVLDIFDRLWLWQQLGVMPDTLEQIQKTRAENR